MPLEKDINDLHKILSVVGPIKELSKIIDNDGQYKGHCNLIYETEDLTKRASNMILGMEIDGKPIAVKRITTSESDENVLAG